MKNIAISKGRIAEVVTGSDLIAAMVPNHEYTVDEICALLHDRPRTAVRDSLHKLVERGLVWRATARSPIKFILLEGEKLREAIERKTTHATPPDWMRANLVGYDAQQRAFRDLCMATRK